MKATLSPRELAEAIGVSESSLKRWADSGRIVVSRTSGGHRRIAMAEAIRFIRENRATIVRPDILGFPDLEAAAWDDLNEHDEGERLYNYLRDGKMSEARGVIMAAYLSGKSIAALADGPIRDCMTRLGELWKNEDDGIMAEHRATDICIQAVQQLRGTLQAHPRGIVAVGCAPSGDPYLLPSLLAAAALAAEGFRTINLGPETPTEVLAQAISEHNARLAWISISSLADAQALTDAIIQLNEQLNEMDCELAVGGRCADQLNIPPGATLFQGATIGELVAYARGMRARVNAPASDTDTQQQATA